MKLKSELKGHRVSDFPQHCLDFLSECVECGCWQKPGGVKQIKPEMPAALTQTC